MAIALTMAGCGAAEDEPGASFTPPDYKTATRDALAATAWTVTSATQSGNALANASNCIGLQELQIGARWTFSRGSGDDDSVTIASPCETAPLAVFFTILDDQGDARIFTDPTGAHTLLRVIDVTESTFLLDHYYNGSIPTENYTLSANP